MSAPAAPERARAKVALAFVLPAFALGFVVAAQLQTQSGRTPLATRYQLTLAEAAVEMQSDHARLKEQLAALRAGLDSVQVQGAGLDVRAAAIGMDIDRLKEQAGLARVTGAGVTVTLDDARLAPSTPKGMIELAIVHSSDITDVINAAWRAGARAIAINGERIAGASACVGAVIQINGTLLSPPFVISVIGPRDRLYAVLDSRDELVDQKRRRDAFGLGLRIERGDALTAPAYSGPLQIRYALAY